MKVIVPVMLLMLSACSNVPVAIKDAPNPDLQLAQVSDDAVNQKGQRVRWGGQIVKVENNDEGAFLHIAQFPLNSFGRPITSDDSDGRFLAYNKTFVDPYIYKKGTSVTVAGVINNTSTIKVDQKIMTVPVVQVTDLYRWTVSHYDRDPYWRGYPYYYDHFGYGVSYPYWRSRWHYGRGYYW